MKLWGRQKSKNTKMNTPARGYDLKLLLAVWIGRIFLNTPARGYDLKLAVCHNFNLSI